MNKKNLLLIALICSAFMQIFAGDPDATPTESPKTNPASSPKTNSVPDQYSGTRSASSPAVRNTQEGFPPPQPGFPVLSEIPSAYDESPEPSPASSNKRSASPSGHAAPKKLKNDDAQTPSPSPQSHGPGFYDFPKFPKVEVEYETTEKLVEESPTQYQYNSPTGTDASDTPSPSEETVKPVKNPFAVGIYQIKNEKQIESPQQDYYQTLPAVDPKTGLTLEPTEAIQTIPYKLYGVYDGHGLLGANIAQQVSQKLLSYIAGRIGHEFPADQKKVNAAITESFEQIDREISKTYELGGATAIVALVYGDTIIVANAGDSRAVIATYPIKTPRQILIAQLLLDTKDHKPGPPEAKVGPEGINEYSRLKTLQKTPATPPAKRAWRIQSADGSIAVSRSIGDRQFKDLGMIARPEIYTLTLTAEMENPFIIVACDGIWDVITNQDAADLVASSLQRNQNDGTIAAQDLVWRARSLGSQDDLTTIVIPIPPTIGSTEDEKAGPAPRPVYGDALRPV